LKREDSCQGTRWLLRSGDAYSVQSNRFSEVEKVTTSQDDGFAEGLNHIWAGCVKRRNIKKSHSLSG
jgi:hypothetical protein